MMIECLYKGRSFYFGSGWLSARRRGFSKRISYCAVGFMILSPFFGSLFSRDGEQVGLCGRGAVLHRAEGKKALLQALDRGTIGFSVIIHSPCRMNILVGIEYALQGTSGLLSPPDACHPFR